ncbi:MULTISPECIES: PTS sugar transporter subunit IIA [unclassified Enterococcus]|uniref:PTS sugar transporter subunit IIA n=1 Tax=unclassified Enterococcus TaxID=2608891 RepID=UPI0013EB7C85|nr:MULTISPECIES: PTS sugar transporter subunit IIA [unclassified Enterococcus]
MIGIVIATHGELSTGLKDAAEVILGTASQIETIQLKQGEDVQKLGEKLKEKIQQTAQGEGVIVFADMLSASPYNQSLLASNELSEELEEAIYVISGVNLPMLIEAINHQLLHSPIEEAVQQISAQGTASVSVWQNQAEEEEELEEEF